MEIREVKCGKMSACLPFMRSRDGIDDGLQGCEESMNASAAVA